MCSLERLKSPYAGVERCLLVRKAIATESRPALLSPTLPLDLRQLLQALISRVIYAASVVLGIRMTKGEAIPAWVAAALQCNRFC